MNSPLSKQLVQCGRAAMWQSSSMAEIISAPLRLCVKKVWEVKAWAS